MPTLCIIHRPKAIRSKFKFPEKPKSSQNIFFRIQTMAEEGQVISCHTVEIWNEHFQKGKESKKLVVVDFTASWCPPCRLIAPVLADLAKKLPEVIFLKVDVDELKSVAEEWKVEAMPTFLFLKEGKAVDRLLGAKKEELQAFVTKHAVVAAA